jgi:hypothetical protein
MVVGIGFVTLITAAIASRFIQTDDGGVGGELRPVRERLDRVEACSPLNGPSRSHLL